MTTLEETARGTPTGELRALFLCLGAHIRGDREAEAIHRETYQRERAKRVVEATAEQALPIHEHPRTNGGRTHDGIGT